MSEQLKPCPFCGGIPQLHAISFGDRWFVDCLKCLGRGSETYLRDDAISAWNKRPTHDALVDALKEADKLADMCTSTFSAGGMWPELHAQGKVVQDKICAALKSASEL